MVKSMEAIRRQFPSPISLGDDHAMFDDYCVGGALVRAADLYSGTHGDDHCRTFPTEYDVMLALQMLNPQLPDEDAQKYAQAIIEANDAKEMEHAWALVKEALDYATPPDYHPRAGAGLPPAEKE